MNAALAEVIAERQHRNSSPINPCEGTVPVANRVALILRVGAGDFIRHGHALPGPTGTAIEETIRGFVINEPLAVEINRIRIVHLIVVPRLGIERTGEQRAFHRTLPGPGGAVGDQQADAVCIHFPAVKRFGFVTGVSRIKHPELSVIFHDLKALAPDVVKGSRVPIGHLIDHLPFVTIGGSQVIVFRLEPHPIGVFSGIDVHEPDMILPVMINDSRRRLLP